MSFAELVLAQHFVSLLGLVLCLLCRLEHRTASFLGTLGIRISLILYMSLSKTTMCLRKDQCIACNQLVGIVF